MSGIKKFTVQERFEAFIMPVPEAGCWLWMGGGRGTFGYGGFAVHHHKNVVAHRYSYELATGKPIPDGMWVLHKCDTPQCVNPDHLFLGTHTDNMRDCRKKGRHAVSKRTHCKNGHEFTPENTRFWRSAGGKRVCVTCLRNNQKRKSP